MALVRPRALPGVGALLLSFCCWLAPLGVYPGTPSGCYLFSWFSVHPLRATHPSILLSLGGGFLGTPSLESANPPGQKLEGQGTPQGFPPISRSPPFCCLPARAGKTASIFTAYARPRLGLEERGALPSSLVLDNKTSQPSSKPWGGPGQRKMLGEQGQCFCRGALPASHRPPTTTQATPSSLFTC